MLRVSVLRTELCRFDTERGIDEAATGAIHYLDEGVKYGVWIRGRLTLQLTAFSTFCGLLALQGKESIYVGWGGEVKPQKAKVSAEKETQIPNPTSNKSLIHVFWKGTELFTIETLRVSGALRWPTVVVGTTMAVVSVAWITVMCLSILVVSARTKNGIKGVDGDSPHQGQQW